MTATWTQVVLVLLPVVVGAAIGVAPTILVERARQRAALRTRWDVSLHRTCADFAASARRILDLSEQRPGPTAAGQDSSVDSIRNEHSRLQILMAEVRLLGNEEVQRSARMVVRHTWAVYVLATGGPDPRATEYDEPPRGRALSSLLDFYRSVRRQLVVPDADKIAQLNPPDPGSGQAVRGGTDTLVPPP
jgi:hypothetical protein